MKIYQNRSDKIAKKHLLRIKIIPDCGATGSLPKRNSSRMARSTVELARFVSEDNQLRRSRV